MSQPSTAEPTKRHVAFFVVAASVVLLAVATLAIDRELQREWLSAKWLYKSPYALVVLDVCAVLSGLAWIATLAAVRRGRARNSPWPALRWLAPLLVAAWISLWIVPRPVLVFDAQLAFAAGLTIWSIALAALAWRAASAWPRRARLVELIALDLALCLVGAELALRGVRTFSDSRLLATAGTSVDAWLRVHRLPPGSFYRGFRVNSSGYVDSEPRDFAPGSTLVACIGDSFSVGVVPHHLHYTTVAERELHGVEVYDVGVADSGPREYLRMLERDVAPLAPKLVVVALFLGNDLDNAERREPTLLERWIDPDEVLIRVVPRRCFALAAEGGATQELVATSNEELDAAAIEKRLPWLAHPLDEPPMMSDARFFYVEQTRTEFLLPQSAPRYAATFAWLEKIREAARPAPIACLLIPDVMQVEDELWNRVRADLPPNAERDQPQRLVAAWLDAHGVPYVDLLPRLRAEAPLADGQRHLFHHNDTHFNARGNAVAGRALAELVRQAGLGR